MEEKRLAILQSNYIPWKGYMDIIGLVDEFVILDDVQFTRRDWRNRNLIKTASGLKWLTIPVECKGKFSQAIKDTRISDRSWCEKHWESIRHSYSRARYFTECAAWLKPLYEAAEKEEMLSRVNRLFLEGLCAALGIGTRLSWSMDYAPAPGKAERILDICLQAGATRYLNGPKGKGYLDAGLFARSGVTLEWMDYEGYREYRQLFPPFEHKVSVIDLLMNEGEKAGGFLKCAEAR